jgi:hypothetical protein
VTLDARHKWAHNDIDFEEARCAVLAMCLCAREVASRRLGASGDFETQLRRILERLEHDAAMETTVPQIAPVELDRTRGEQRALPLPRAWAFLNEKGLEEAVKRIRAVRGRSSDRRRAEIAKILQRANLLGEFVLNYWPYGGTEHGRKLIKRYLKAPSNER